MENSEYKGERIAKHLARAGIASRREVERMIEAGRITVNGKMLDSPALNVVPSDRILVDNKPVASAEPTRLWRYHKPKGLVTTDADEKGRQTIYDKLPEDMPRVMSIGRLDLNSEGLLLLTNDGELKRKLELPSTGWVRKYRVRANGEPTDATFAPLRKGVTIDGERFLPMDVTLDRQQGANVWLTIGLREGKNREIRRAMEEVGLTVNRLIRLSYGPFQIGDLALGAVEEVRPAVLRDQLGIKRAPDVVREVAKTEPKSPRVRQVRQSAASPGISFRGKKRAGDAVSRAAIKSKPANARPTDDARPPRGNKPSDAGRPPRGDKPAYGKRPDGDKKPYGKPGGRRDK